MKRLLLRLTCVVLLLLAVAVPAFARRKNANARVMNFSKWEIHHIYLSETQADNWGIDRLRGRVLVNGDTITISNLACDTYDMKIVDQDGDECVIEEVELCNGTTTWRITDKDLLECEGYEE